jgi:Arc/MetJ-type ribon-helix-helix transcriptional regulator
MRKVVKVTVSLPNEIAEMIERQREGGQSRSEVIVGLLRAALREDQERADVERYIQSYLEHPETEEELRESEAILAHATVWDPWE